MEPAFWDSATRIDALRALLIELLGRDKAFTAERVHKLLLADPTVPSDDILGARALRSFVDGEVRRPHNDRSLGHLLAWAVNVVKRNDIREILESETYATALTLYQEFRRTGSRAGSRDDTSDEPGPIEILNLFKVSASAVGTVSNKMFGQSALRKDYICYRYHSRPGQIVKSALVINAPSSPQTPISTFASTFREGGVIRETTGILLPMRKATYLVGEIEGGAGLKAIVVPSLEERKSSYPGLLMSMDEDFKPIVGRCVLIPWEGKPASIFENVGIFSESEIAAEAQPYLEMFRNRLQFTLNDKLYFDGAEIGQREMVARVVELCSKDNKLRFSKSGRPFNPASTKDYSFNVALRTYDPSVIDED